MTRRRWQCLRTTLLICWYLLVAEWERSKLDWILWRHRRRMR